MLIVLLACVDPVLQLQGDADAGEALYQADCVLCHGTNGEGTSRGPELVDLSDRLARSLTLDVVRDGRGTMPGYDYADQQLADLLAYLDTL